MALQDALVAVVGDKLTKAAICVLLAHSELEVGPPSNLPANNFGGIKRSGNYDYAEWVTREGHGENERVVKQYFRAYSTPQEGAEDFVRLLAKSPRYSRAWAKLIAGDPVSYAFELGKAGYFTADPKIYARGLQNRWAKCGLRSMSYGITPDEVRRFQASHSCVPDGALGPQTYAAIRAALSPAAGLSPEE